jgi:hypothetical protein
MIDTGEVYAPFVAVWPIIDPLGPLGLEAVVDLTEVARRQGVTAIVSHNRPREVTASGPHFPLDRAIVIDAVVRVPRWLALQEGCLP